MVELKKHLLEEENALLKRAEVTLLSAKREDLEDTKFHETVFFHQKGSFL